jgi:small GTP-binding protein
MENYKIIVLGDSGSGKTSIITRYLTNIFDKTLCGGTIGVDYHSKNSNNMKVQIWDTAGQERFRSITNVYYRGTNAAIIVFDTNNEDVNNGSIELWIDEILKYVEDSIIMLIGNKCDLTSKHKVDVPLLKSKYSQMIGYIETSAKRGTNIQESFEKVISKFQDKGKVMTEILLDKPIGLLHLNKPIEPSTPCCG